MSLSVLVIPEDPTYNGYILRPLVGRMLEECERPNAKIRVLDSPRARGYEHAKSLIAGGLLDRYTHMDLVLFLPDADGEDKSESLKTLEQRATEAGVTLICECAIQEIEVWLLAGHLGELKGTWQQVREERHSKERFFKPFLREHGNTLRAGEGRDLLMQQTLKNYPGLLARCPELKALQERIGEAVASR